MDARGPYSLASSMVSARAPALPSDRLVTSGSGSGIPPVITMVPPPASAIAGARWTAAVMAPRTLIAYAAKCRSRLSSPGRSRWISPAL